MRLLIRRASERGHANHGWLDTYHTFSFADYEDHAWMGFGTLRVINEDRIKGGAGFGKHGHRDMEIITYVMQGALRHTDSMGNGEVLKAGEFQRMTAGTGVLHSEENASATEECHLYQIWIHPGRRNLEPSYEQKLFVQKENHPGGGRGPAPEDGRILIASPDARQGSLKIHQDAELWLYRLRAGETAKIDVPEGKVCWLQVVSGEVEIEDQTLSTSDAAGFMLSAKIEAESPSEFMVFLL